MKMSTILFILFALFALFVVLMFLMFYGATLTDKEYDIACQNIGYDEYRYTNGLQYCINNEEMQLVNTKCNSSSIFYVDSCEAYKMVVKGFSIK